MNPEYEAIIFDMDGTLIDSMWVWTKLDQKFFEERNMSMPDTLAKDIEGLSMQETAEYFIRTFHLDYEIQELMQIWNEMASWEYANEVPYKKGAFRFLKQVKKLGIKTGIATSNSRELVEMADKRLHFMSYIDVLVTTNEVPNGKPAPDIYLKVAKALQVDPEKCLVFEDIPSGILAGKNAGMATCAVQDDFSAHLEEEKRHLADYFIDSFQDIL
ncbi:MAG: HAD family hydrolase [Lachnospiraceae bacterium]